MLQNKENSQVSTGVSSLRVTVEAPDRSRFSAHARLRTRGDPT